MLQLEPKKVILDGKTQPEPNHRPTNANQNSNLALEEEKKDSLPEHQLNKKGDLLDYPND